MNCARTAEKMLFRRLPERRATRKLTRMISRTAAVVLVLAAGCGSPAQPIAPTPSASAAPEPAPTAKAPPPAEDAGAPADAAAEAAEAPPEEGTSGTPRERLMRAHFKETALIRKAVIDGALEAAVSPAADLKNMKGLGTIQKGWKPSLDALGNAAQRFGQSPDLPAAAAAIADIGVACGTCHKSGGGPKVNVEAAPTPDKSLASQMKRHAWAAERLWEGLYVPSDAAWKAGADALAAEKFPEEVLKKGGVHARSAATRFGTLAPTLAAQKTAGERAKVYAAVLETCSSCHMAARKK